MILFKVNKTWISGRHKFINVTIKSRFWPWGKFKVTDATLFKCDKMSYYWYDKEESYKSYISPCINAQVSELEANR